jgi:kynurenine 3-monooxygenase
MVTFHRIPYSVALTKGKIQDRILAELCESIDRVEELDWEKAERLIRKELRTDEKTEQAKTTS